jgi:hypothetical protein
VPGSILKERDGLYTIALKEFFETITGTPPHAGAAPFHYSGRL